MRISILDIIIILLQSIAGIFVLFNIIKVNVKNQKKEIFVSFISFLILMLFSNFMIPNHLRFIFSILVLTAITFYIDRSSLSESLATGLVTVGFIAVTEVIFCYLFSIFGISQKELIENQFWNFIENVLISCFMILLLSLNQVSLIVIKFKNILIKRKNLFYSFIIIFLFLYLIVLKNYLFANFTLDMMINLAILLFAVLLFIVIFISDSKNNKLKDENQQMLNYVTKYEKIITEQGKVNHEFKNQLMVIRGYAQMNSPKLIEYLDSIVKDSSKAGSSYLISQLNKFPDGGIKGLLYYKLSVMEEEKIKYEINVETGVKTKLNNLSTNMYKNITKILGVLLDNAIDASKLSKNKEIIIVVTKEKARVIFKIYNTYKGKIDLSKVGTGHTTKGKGHGYGLRLVNDILKANKRFGVSSYLENQYYVSKLIIKILSKNKLTTKK